MKRCEERNGRSKVLVGAEGVQVFVSMGTGGRAAKPVDMMDQVLRCVVLPAQSLVYWYFSLDFDWPA